MPKVIALKIFLLSFLLVLSASMVALFAPKLIFQTQKVLAISDVEVPENNLSVAKTEKFVYPPISAGIPAPYTSAKSILVKDLTTDTVLFQKFADTRLPIASTTKIMTALVSSEYFDANSPLTVRTGASVSGSSAGLYSGETLSFRSLLYGMLLNSGNDAAYTIAENYPGGVSAFVVAMNQKAVSLGLVNTHFDNPAGFDSPNHYSSASDLAKITEVALKNSDLSRIFATKETQISSLDKKQTHRLVNLNILLSKVPGMMGVKTGYTDVAKENLVGLVERDNHRVLTVVLNSDDRFGETTKLIDWTFQNYSWR